MHSIETDRAQRINSGKSWLLAVALLAAALLLFPISAFVKSQNSNMVDLQIKKQKYESDFRKWIEKLFQSTEILRLSIGVSKPFNTGKIFSISNYPWQISILVQKLSYNEYWGGNRQRLGS